MPRFRTDLVHTMRVGWNAWDRIPPGLWYDPELKIYMDGPMTDARPVRTAFSPPPENDQYLTDRQRQEDATSTRIRRSLRIKHAKEDADRYGRAYRSPEHTPEREIREREGIAEWHRRQARPAPPPTLCERLWNFFFGF